MHHASATGGKPRLDNLGNAGALLIVRGRASPKRFAGGQTIEPLPL